jgi:putative ABC transport system ATP-binding protein
MATILNIQNLGKSYQSAGRTLTVLENINFSVEAGSTMAIVGPSGSGKTTLLGLAAGLDRSSTGTVELNNIKLDQLNEDQRASIRNQHVGFIFQNFQLLHYSYGAWKMLWCHWNCAGKKYKAQGS